MSTVPEFYTQGHMLADVSQRLNKLTYRTANIDYKELCHNKCRLSFPENTEKLKGGSRSRPFSYANEHDKQGCMCALTRRHVWRLTCKHDNEHDIASFWHASTIISTIASFCADRVIAVLKLYLFLSFFQINTKPLFYFTVAWVQPEMGSVLHGVWQPYHSNQNRSFWRIKYLVSAI